MKAPEFQKDHSPPERPHVISQKVTRKVFESDLCQKTTTLAQKKNISVFTVSRMVKKMGGIIWDILGNPYWEQQWFRSVWGQAPVCWMTWIIMEIESLFFSRWESFTVDPFFNKRNDRVVNLYECCLCTPQRINN